MGESVWYRGTTEGVPAVSGGAVIHDFGDGIYFTNKFEVAKMYAETRQNGSGARALIFEVRMNLAAGTNVWVLHEDPAWRAFLNEKLGSLTNEQVIQAANENYGKMFQNFVRAKKLEARLQAADVIIGPEYVRGGMQLCIRHRNGQPSPLAAQMLPQLRLVWQNGKKVEPLPAPPNYARRGSVGPGSGAVPLSIPTANSPLRQTLGNQAAMAAFGQGIIEMNMRNMDRNLMRAAEEDLQSRLAKPLQTMLSRGDGVLAIIAAFQTKWIDGAGQQYRSYHNTYLEPGPDPDAAASRFFQRPSMSARREDHEMIYYFRWFPSYTVVR